MKRDEGAEAVGAFVAGVINDHRARADARQIRDAIDQRDNLIEGHEAHIDAQFNELINVREFLAAEVALCSAALTQLALYDPKNPLIVDNNLVDEIKTAGIKTHHKDDSNFRKASAAGDKFPVPASEFDAKAGRGAPFEYAKQRAFLLSEYIRFAAYWSKKCEEDATRHKAEIDEINRQHKAVLAELALSKDKLEGTENDLARHLAQRVALRHIMRAEIPDHPLEQDAGLRDRISSAATKALVLADPNNRWEAVADAAAQVIAPVIDERRRAAIEDDDLAI